MEDHQRRVAPFQYRYAAERDVDAAAAALTRIRAECAPLTEAMQLVTIQAIAACQARGLSVRQAAAALDLSKSDVHRTYKSLDRGIAAAATTLDRMQSDQAKQLIVDAWSLAAGAARRQAERPSQ